MENQNIRASVPWEHSLTTLLGHDSTSDPGIALRQWVHFQGVHNILDLLSWEEEELKAIPSQQIFTLVQHAYHLSRRYAWTFRWPMKKIAKPCSISAR